MYIPTSLLNIVACAGDEDTLYVLTAVAMQVKEGKPILTATDSRKLIYAYGFPIEGDDENGTQDGVWLIPRWAFDAAIKALKVRHERERFDGHESERFDGYVKLQFDQERFTLTMPTWGQSEANESKWRQRISFSGPLALGKFPDWQAIVPPESRKTDPVNPVLLDPKFVRDGINALAGCVALSEYSWPGMKVAQGNIVTFSMRSPMVNATLIIMQMP